MTSADELCFLSAVEALALFRTGELSPVELLEAIISQAERVETVINAFAEVRWDEARRQALEAERRYAGHGESPRPLEGLTVAVKEEEAIEGWGWTQGSVPLKDEVAPYTSSFAQRVIDSGAIVHARTTTPEFCAGPYTLSRLWGITRNPWNPDFAVGGSSGGSAAALAAGTTTLATGSDIAGSIRIPASFCGVVGFRGPYGRVPIDAPYNYETYLANGAMGRSVADTALLQNVLAGPHPDDPNAIAPKLTLPDRFADVAGMRIAVSVDLGGWPVDDEVAENTRRAAERLREQGAVVDEVELSISSDVVTRISTVHFLATIAGLKDVLAAYPDDLSPYLQVSLDRILQGSDGGTIAEEWELSQQLHATVAAVHRDYDVLLCPTVATVGLPAEEDFISTKLQVGGVEVSDPIEAVFTVPFNILNRYPVLAVPSGRAANGVPTGLQIVGRPFDDCSVFAVGAALEQHVSLGRPHLEDLVMPAYEGIYRRLQK